MTLAAHTSPSQHGDAALASTAPAVAPEATWHPSTQRTTRLQQFIDAVAATGAIPPDADYHALWTWSVTDVSGFWEALRNFFGVAGTGFDGPALAEDRMPGAVWYPGASLNFAEHVLGPAVDPARMHETAIFDLTEDDTLCTYSWAELADWTARTAAEFTELGVSTGDHVVAVLPNVPEAIVGLLAAASIGATWSICSPDLAPDVVISRFAQLEPTVLVGTVGYAFNGKHFDRREYLTEIAGRLPSLRGVVETQGFLGDAAKSADDARPSSLPVLPFPEPHKQTHDSSADPAPQLLRAHFASLPFDHPLWVLFSSGTTGTPKGIVHGHGGMLLESLKNSGLAHDMGPGDVYYVAANTSWMVWNTLVANLAAGAAIVTYAGSPTYGAATRQFEVIERCGATMFGVGAAYLTLVEKNGAIPSELHDLSSLRNILSTGSPLPPSTWRWVHSAVKPDVHLGSDSGGTDICSGLVGSNFISPVYLGESQGALLGVAAAAWNDRGEAVIGEVGELVVTRPMPSMPLCLWGDTGGERYRESYFSVFPGVWAQGDWVTETPRHGFIVHGRSDATLNRQGVRLGTADIYAALQEIEAVNDSLVLGVEGESGEYWMPLFVAPSEGSHVDAALKQEITAAIRSHASARHVPDDIIECPGIPLTHAGKRIEVPLKKLFAGRGIDAAAVRGTLRNPDTLDWFIAFAAARDEDSAATSASTAGSASG